MNLTGNDDVLQPFPRSKLLGISFADQARNGLLEEPGMVARRTTEPNHGVIDRVRNGARSLKEQASDTANHVGRAVKKEVGGFFDEQKGKAASKIDNIGSMIDKAGRVLHAGKVDAVAEYVDMAAETAQQASHYLENHDFDEIAADAGELVKRHPATVFAGALVLGLLAGRFIKAAQEDSSQED